MTKASAKSIEDFDELLIKELTDKLLAVVMREMASLDSTLKATYSSDNKKITANRGPQPRRRFSIPSIKKGA